MKNELTFLAGQFFDYELPKEKQYLLKYFRTDLDRQFLRYYFCFEQYEHFTDHTGMRCQEKWLRALKKKLDHIVSVHDEAKREGKLSLLTKIESGKYSLTKEATESDEE
jgi:hypothetical protein